MFHVTSFPVRSTPSASLPFHVHCCVLSCIAGSFLPLLSFVVLPFLALALVQVVLCICCIPCLTFRFQPLSFSTLNFRSIPRTFRFCLFLAVCYLSWSLIVFTFASFLAFLSFVFMSFPLVSVLARTLRLVSFSLRRFPYLAVSLLPFRLFVLPCLLSPLELFPSR